MRLNGIIQLTRSDLEAIKKAIEYLNINCQTNISPESLAEEVGLDIRKLRAGLKEQTSLTVHQFQLKLRIEKAQLDLKDTDLSLKYIAAKNGFKNVSQFGKIFKKRIGKTPMEYRFQIDAYRQPLTTI
jgi:transcriptional regulator GlxA family with amidase domain